MERIWQLLNPWRLFLLLCFLLGGTLGAHPHSDASADVKSWYHSRRKRRRLRGIQGQDRRQLVNPALCHDVTDAECEEMNQDMIDHARSLRSVSEQGPVRALVLLMRFTNHVGNVLPSADTYRELFMGQDISDVIPTGSIHQWMHYNSYGRLNVTFDVVDWATTDNSDRFYSFGQSGLSYDFSRSYYPPLDRLDQQGFDFSRYDQNNDGVIDSLIVLHSGHPAEVGGLECETNLESKFRIWAHAVARTSSNWRSRDGRYGVRGYAVASALRGTCGGRAARISVICHEYMHTFGLSDLNDLAGDYIGKGVGEYDIMANSHGMDGSQNYPAHLSPKSKVQLGWVLPKPLTRDGVVTIVASEYEPDIYMVETGYPVGEYLLIENRQPFLWDELLSGGGILIWHIDEKQERVKNRGYPGMTGWPGNGKHYDIALEQADGSYDLERGNNGFDDGDFWKMGRRAYAPGRAEHQATEYGQYPNSNSYQNGRVQQTGITIDEFSQSKRTMQFRIAGLNGATPASSPEPSQSPTEMHRATWDPSSQPGKMPSQQPSESPSRSDVRAISLNLDIENESSESSTPPEAPLSAPSTLPDQTAYEPLAVVSPTLTPTPAPKVWLTPVPTIPRRSRKPSLPDLLSSFQTTTIQTTYPPATPACHIALAFGDINNDGQLSKAEFVYYAHRMSRSLGKEGANLPRELESLFSEFATQDGHIIIKGSRIGSEVDSDQQSLLNKLCYLTLKAFDTPKPKPTPILDGMDVGRFNDLVNLSIEKTGPQSPNSPPTPALQFDLSDSNVVVVDMAPKTKQQPSSESSEYESADPAPLFNAPSLRPSAHRSGGNSENTPQPVELTARPTRPLPQCLAGMMKADKDQDKVLNQQEYLVLVEFLEPSLEGILDPLPQPMRAAYNDLLGESDNGISINGLPQPDDKQLKSLLRICTDTNSAISAFVEKDRI